jgi:hypothetical protein
LAAKLLAALKSGPRAAEHHETMKPREHAVPSAQPADRPSRPVTQEIADDTDVDVLDLDTADPADSKKLGAVPSQPLDTAEMDWGRDRRVTLISTIPAEIAAEMATKRAGKERRAEVVARDPAAPMPDRFAGRGGEQEHHTRRLGDLDNQRLTPASGSGRVSEADGVARRRQRAATLIDRARAALDEGNLTVAVDAAEGALREADEAPPPGIVEVIEPARPLLTRVFAAYVGSLSEVPVLAPRAAEIARDRLGDHERSLIGRIDGLRTLEELFDGSGLGSTDALRIAARLIRTGAIRVV